MKKLFYLSFTILLSLGLSAQESLSLSDAIRIGLERNYGILIENKNVETAENNNEWGNTGILPTVTLSGASNNSIQSSSGESFFLGNVFPFDIKDQRSYGLAPNANVSWTLLGNRAFISKRRLDQMESQSMQNAEVVVANTLQTIIGAYYLAALERDRLGEFGRQLQLSSDKFDYIKTKQSLGGAVTSDVLLEENNFLTDSANFINQRLALNNAFRNLNVVMAEPDLNRSYNLTDSLEVEEVVYLLEDLEAALSQNVDLKQIYLNQSVLELTTRERRADQLPSLSFNGGYNWNRSVSDNRFSTSSDPNFVAPDRTFLSKTGNLSFNFTLSFTLFDGHRINRAINNAMVQEDIGNLRIDQLRQSISKDLLDAYDQYSVRRQLYEINKRRREAADINLQNSEEKFRNGSINSFDYRDVQNNKLSAAIQELQSIYNLIDSKISLMRLTGGLLGQYNQ